MLNMPRVKRKSFEEISKGRGRPKKEIDFEKFDSLCRKGFNQADLCDFFDMDHETMNARIYEKHGVIFSQYVKRFEAERKQAILDMYWKRAEQSDQILKELGREFLGFGKETPKQEESGKIVIEVKGNLLNVDAQVTDEITKRIGSVIDGTVVRTGLVQGQPGLQGPSLSEEALSGDQDSDREPEDS